MTIENIIESDLQPRVEVMILFFTASTLIHERRCKDERCGSFLLSYLILWFLSVKPWKQRSVLVSGNPADGELLPGPRTHWCHCVCSIVEKGAAQARCPNYRWEDEKKTLLFPLFLQVAQYCCHTCWGMSSIKSSPQFTLCWYFTVR